MLRNMAVPVGGVWGVPTELVTSPEECLSDVSENVSEESPVSCYRRLLVGYLIETDHWALWLRPRTAQEEVPRRQLSWCPAGYVKRHVRVGRTHSPFEPESSGGGSPYGWRGRSHFLLSRRRVPVHLRSRALDPHDLGWNPSSASWP